MSTTFWEHIDWSDSADDSFSLGLSRVKSEFWNGWQKAQHKVIPSCDEERFSRAHTKSVPAGNFADTLPYAHWVRELFPPKMGRRYPLRRDFLKLFRKLCRTLLQSAFSNWLSTVRDLIQVHFHNVFEIAAANPERTREDNPQEFAYQFLNALVEGVVKERADGLCSDGFLGYFLGVRNTRSEEADMLVLLRELVRATLHMYVVELSSTAQIELAKRCSTKATKTESVLAQQSQVIPAQDDAGSQHALTQQSEVVVTPDEAGSASTLRLRFLDEPPDNLSVRVVVLKIFPQLKKTLHDAHYYVVGGTEKWQSPFDAGYIPEIPVGCNADESQIERYVIRREGSSANKAALHMIQEICGLSVEKPFVDIRAPCKDKSSREQHSDGSGKKIRQEQKSLKRLEERSYIGSATLAPTSLYPPRHIFDFLPATSQPPLARKSLKDKYA